jgi:hypothetical protein
MMSVESCARGREDKLDNNKKSRERQTNNNKKLEKLRKEKKIIEKARLN